jgi:hypothetical protein
MSVDSERMLKLENKVAELKSYINKLVGAVKSDSNNSIEALQKSVNEIKVYNKAKVAESKIQTKELKVDTNKKEIKTIDIKSEIKSVVTKEYINAIYRNK